MNQLRKLTKVAPLLLAGCVGGGAASWSPISCACIEAWQNIATSFGHFGMTDPDQITSRFIADSIRNKFDGKVVRAMDLPIATSTHDCVDSDNEIEAIRCTWWLWESGDEMKGFNAVISTTRQGIFQRVAVKPVTSLDA